MDDLRALRAGLIAPCVAVHLVAQRLRTRIPSSMFVLRSGALLGGVQLFVKLDTGRTNPVGLYAMSVAPAIALATSSCSLWGCPLLEAHQLGQAPRGRGAGAG